MRNPDNRVSATAMRLIVLLMFLAITAIGSPVYCVYEVKVSKPSGVPVAKVPVGIVEKGTQGATVWTDINGVARFCDAPLHAVDIVVGTQDCAVVLVEGVKPTWPMTRDIFVTYDETHCGGEFIRPDHCQVLLRIQDDEGRPLPGARFDSGRSEGDASDIFGRIFRRLKSGETLRGIVMKEGHKPVPILERCVRGNERDRELKVVLRK